MRQMNSCIEMTGNVAFLRNHVDILLNQHVSVNGFAPGGYFGPNVFPSNGMMLQQLSGRRKRRHRTIFTDEQLVILETNFSSNAYPDISLREKLAIQCDLKEERVEVWFKVSAL